MSLTQRSLTSITWNSAANLIRIIVLLLRSIMLARLLPVETFGIYAYAASIVSITAIFAGFGMSGAFLHRAPEVENEDRAASTHFTLTLLFTLVWALVLSVGALLFTDGSTRVALLILIITTGGAQLFQTPWLILIRRVVHRRVVLIQTVNVIVIALIAIGLAWRGATLWALLSTNIASLVLGLLAWYGWRPVWRPRLSWDVPAIRYFLRFGSRNFMANVLSALLDRVDDLWTGVFLGQTALGFYSRSYTFATYPSTILAQPVNNVTVGTYAELKGDRRRLSQAFFRINALLVRTGFFLAGWLVLVAPELINLVLGSKWTPMVTTFRLMLLFTLLEPIKLTVANLFVAVGQPERVVQARVVQLIVMLLGLWGLGLPFGITGVALAVDIMLLVGIAFLLSRANDFVDFSWKQLFFVPGLALLLGLGLSRAALLLPNVLGSDWRTGIIKTVIFLLLYGVVLFLGERKQLFRMVIFAAEHIPGRVSQWILLKSARWQNRLS